ncbi:MAG: MHFG family PEP-CTERM protein [Burkholderiaceae bacterium]|nr:MHFG family PEP-CTERM protein [Roseateles sp.]MBV8469726.1 MHFG family PEP-CTERM protein [Burkholderiaceae bacterium]
MSIVLAWALAASSVNLSQCSWDRPGVNPYMGDVVEALDHYHDMPADVLAKLKSKMQRRAYDDVVLIRRDRIEGTASYDSEITDMHFGSGSVCHTVTRKRWPADQVERGLVFCEGDQCVVVPTVCRNVSRLHRLDRPQAVLAARDMDPEDQALVFDPPGAGGSGAGTDPGLMGSPLAGDSAPFTYQTAGFGVPEGVDGGGFGPGASTGGTGPGSLLGGLPAGGLAGGGLAGGGGGGGSKSDVNNGGDGSGGSGGGSNGGGSGGNHPPGKPVGPEVPPILPIPEPASMMLTGAALLSATWARRRAQRAQRVSGPRTSADVQPQAFQT